MAPVKTSASGSRIRKKIESSGPLSMADIIKTYKLTKRDLAAVDRALEEVRRRRKSPPTKVVRRRAAK